MEGVLEDFLLPKFFSRVEALETPVMASRPAAAHTQQGR